MDPSFWNHPVLSEAWDGNTNSSIPSGKLQSSPETPTNAQPPPWYHSFSASDASATEHTGYFKPPNDFTSQQAAQALTSLCHPPTHTFGGDSFLDCCQPCELQCDPDEIFPCFSIEPTPCYDTRCSQRCELDGADIYCDDTHVEGGKEIYCCLHTGCSFQASSEPELLHHCTVAHACGARTQWECRGQTLPGPSSFPRHIHNEHCRDEFINPLLLHPDGCSKKPAFPAGHPLCDDCPPDFYSTYKELHAVFPPKFSADPKPCCQMPGRKGSCISDGRVRIPQGPRDVKHIQQTSSASSRKTSLSIMSSKPTVSSPMSPTTTEQLDGLLDSKEPEEKIFSCAWVSENSETPCSLVFGSALDVQTHVESAHLASSDQPAVPMKGDQLLCRWEGCQFAQAKKKWRQIQHLKDHMRTHTKHKAFRCEICQRLFSEKKSLEQHRRIHTGEKPFKCEDCGASFSHQSTLSTHRRTHTGEKPYCCEICGHRDADHANFQRHKLIHEPAQYKCEYCNAEFKKKANMLRHQKKNACKGLKEKNNES